MKIAEVAAQVPPSLVKIKAFLDSLPNGEVFPNTQVSKQVNFHKVTLQRFRDELQDYRQFFRREVYWGNRKSIADFRRQIGAAK